MARTLLLRLPASGDEETEWVILGEGEMPTRQRGTLSLAAAVWRSGRLVVLAPSTQVLLAEPELPPGSGPKLARAVPFALEEQLTEDVDQLNFAIGRRRDSGGTQVAVVARSVMRDWLAQLSSAGLTAQTIYPDISLMPDNPAQTVLWLEGGRLAVRRPGALPFAVELSPVQEAMAVAGLIHELTDGTPPLKESAVIYMTREDWSVVQPEIERLVDQFESLKVQLLPDGPLSWLAQSLDSTDAVNLLQGEFAQATDTSMRWQNWRTPALLAAGLLTVHVAAQAVQIRQAKQESAKLDGQIAQVFQATLPGQVISDPKRQMKSRLDRFHKSGGGPELFLGTLQTLGGALQATPKTDIQSLSYRENTMELRIKAPSLTEASQLSQIASKQGLSAEIESSQPVNGGIEAHMRVRALGAAGSK
jgi:general secretion pathway protein L